MKERQRHAVAEEGNQPRTLRISFLLGFVLVHVLGLCVLENFWSGHCLSAIAARITRLEEVSVVAVANRNRSSTGEGQEGEMNWLTNLTMAATRPPLSVLAAPTWIPPEEKMIPVQNMSVLRYQACCGLGHRLGRQGAAYHAAHRLGFKLEVRWGDCDSGGSLFDELFYPEAERDLSYVHSANQLYIVDNEIPGYYNADANCMPDELDSYYEMYADLKRRFRQRDVVDRFIKDHFEGHFVIGIHIRTGNGESGDFNLAGRAMAVSGKNYTQRVSNHIQRLLKKNSTHALSPVLFVATDTAEYVDFLRSQLEGVVPVIEWDQEHEPAGTGVFMGQGHKEVERDECLQKWNDMIFDMILLASTDLLIAGQYSSFSQGMPMQLVLGGDPSKRKIKDSFCELYDNAFNISCHSNTFIWCRETKHYYNSLKTLNLHGGKWPEFLSQMKESSQYFEDRAKLCDQQPTDALCQNSFTQVLSDNKRKTGDSRAAGS